MIHALIFQRPVPDPLVRLLQLREYRGGWRQGGYTKSVLQETASFKEVRPLNAPQSTHTYRLLAAWIPLKKLCEQHFL
jgi:hypothetical protein